MMEVKNHLLEEAMVPVDKTITIEEYEWIIGEYLLAVDQGVEIVVTTWWFIAQVIQDINNKKSFLALSKIVYNTVHNLLNILAIDEVERM